MSEYTKLKSQFNKFIRTLKSDELNPYEIKLINLIEMILIQRLLKKC